MSKMGTAFRKERKHRRVALVSLLLSLALVMAGGISAFAYWPGFGDWGWGDDSGGGGKASYTLKVNGSSVQDATVDKAVGGIVNFSSNSIFRATNMTGIKAFRITSDDIYKGADLEISLSNANGDKNWTRAVSNSAGGTEFVYKNSNSITAATFNSLMAQITVRSNPSKEVGSAKGKVSIVFYKNTDMKDKNKVYESATGRSKLSCNFIFYQYATGTVDNSSVKVDYKTDYAASYDSTYAQDVPTGTVNNVPVNPANTTGGKVTFNMYLHKGTSVNKDGSSSLYTHGLYAKVGYQIKTTGSAWDTGVKKVWLDPKYKFARQSWSDDAPVWDESTPIPITIEGLNAGTSYTVRGLIATDGKLTEPKYTEEITFSYQKPNINSFSIGSTTQVYKGGDTMNLSMLTTFNDVNSIGETYTGIDGVKHTGPAVRADLYMTLKRNFEDGYDHSKWYLVKGQSQTMNMTGTEGKIENTFQKAWTNRPVPTTVGAVTGDDTDETLVDTHSAAYKLVITDLYTGYTAVSYSDPFSIDSTPPTDPTVTAVDNQNNAITLNLDDANQTAVTVGGAGAQVSIDIGGSEDGEGSGIREYSYSMYYLATENAVGDSTYEILKGMQGYTTTSHGYSDYTEWTPASDKIGTDGQPVENMSQLVIAKDGYYRILARAVDEAGYQSQIVEAYFRVDLSVPSMPTAYLVKQKVATDTAADVLADPNGKLEEYDNRTYTDNKVWLIAYSNPKTGKTLSTFEFSTDNGLTWKDVKAQTTGQWVLKTENTTETINAYPAGNYHSAAPQKYQVLINVSGLGYNDYTSFMVRAKDSLGNVSFASSPVILRTTPSTVVGQGSISHDPIEVAMAQGNSNINPTDATRDLKIATARKINEKYYGNDLSVYNAAARNHNCTWADDTITGDCTSASCPYKANPDLFSPNDVNIQGISAGSAAADLSKWKFYTHTTNGSATSGPNYEGCIMTADNSDNSGTESYPGQLSGSPTNCLKRKRHIVDLSGNFSLIQFNGVGDEDIVDWLFLHYDQPGNKTIYYTMNTAKCDFHTYRWSGFWFNTTIRQNTSNQWVVSGYLLLLRKGAGSWTVTDRRPSTATCGLEVRYVENMSVTSFMSSGDSAPGSLVASYSPSGSANSYMNFKITIQADNNSLKGYTAAVYLTEGNGRHYPDNFKNLSPIMTCEVGRPKVNGYTIGDTSNASNPFKSDSDCFGIGPILGCGSHGCTVETVVQFSNMSLESVSVRRLAEVVTEPQWGNGKAKFIMNLSDDAVEDFKDPVLTSQIQWRLNNDKARYIGWGLEANKAEAEAFLKRMAGTNATAKEIRKIGMYEVYSTGAASWNTQIDDIAEYLSNQYYVEFGYDAEDISGTTENSIAKEVQAAVANVTADGAVGKGAQFSLENAKSLNLSVTPANYNSSSANPDFPSGRWYMVHDNYGMGNQKDTRSGKYADALDANVTLPGRYTFYFAPDKTGKDNNTLDPKNAVFDFVVNQRPVAQFTGSIDSSGTISITDTSYDPDCKTGPVYADSINGKEFFIDESGQKKPLNYEHTQISGIVKTEWRWELLEKSGEALSVTKKSDWGTTSLNGKTLHELTGYTELPEHAVLTVYCRVTDVATHRVALYDSNDDFIGYKYEKVGGADATDSESGLTSYVTQVNISKNDATQTYPITYAPNSVISLSKTIMYDTAGTSTNPQNKVITVTRESSHSQKDKYFTPSFAIDLGKSYAPNSETNYIPLVANGNDYVAKIKGSTTDVTVLTCTKAPQETGDIGNGTTKGSIGGEWTISYDFINKYVSVGDKMVLQITESTYGYSAEEVAMQSSSHTPVKAMITDSSARAIYLHADSNAPSSQVVTTQTMVNENGTEVAYDYEASNYLDVSQNDRYILVSVSGAEDNEGSVAGYRYYFYDKAPNGTESAYYTQDSTGKLTKVGNAPLTAAMLSSLPAKGGTIKINKNSMRGGPGQPTDSLNLAIFAIDNSTSRTTLTKANETAKTRIEDIKLSVSKPMPTEITVTDNMAQNVAHIGNDAGFYDHSGSADTQTTELGNYSGSAVTVEFTPRTAKYVASSSGTGELVLSTAGNGTEYYQDIYRKADMTGVADIRYTVRYKGRASDEWWTSADYASNNMEEMSVNKQVPAATTLTFTEDGIYELTAVVVNGSGTASAERKVTFTIDKTAPAGMQLQFVDETGTNYVEGKWAQTVTVHASNAYDLNAGDTYYYYSEDNGKTWTKMGAITSTQTHKFSSGEHIVMVKAMDGAGNTMASKSIVIRVDSVAPETPPATLKAESSATEIFTEYLLHLDYISENGRVYSVQNNVTDDRSTEIAIPTGEDVRLEFYPAAGKKLGTVSINGADVEPTGFDSTKGVYYLNITNVKADGVVGVTFPDADEDVVTYSRMRSGVMAMSRAPLVTAYTADSTGTAAGSMENEIMLLSADANAEEAGTGETGGEGSGETGETGGETGGTGTGGETGGTEPEEPTPSTFTVQAFSESASKGKVELSEGEVASGSPVTLTVTPRTKYRISSINVNGENVPFQDSEGHDLLINNGNGTYSYHLTISKDTTIWVYFEEIPYRTVRLSANDSTCGELSLVAAGTAITNLGNGAYAVPVDTELNIQINAKDNYTATKVTVTSGVDVLKTQENPGAMYKYTVPAFTGTDDPGIDIKVDFDVASGVATNTVNIAASVYPDGSAHGTVSPGGDVKIPASGDKVITITPDAGYEIGSVTGITLTGDGEMPVDMLESTVIDPATRVGTVAVPGSGRYNRVEIVFTRKTYEIKNDSTNGGTVRITPQTSEEYHGLDAVPEGVDVKVEVVPREGYKIKELVITHDGSMYTPGAVTSYTIKSLHGYASVHVTFEARVVSHTVTAHKITATANNVKDADDALAAEPYQFQISDGTHTSAWTPWSSSNSYTFTGILERGATEEIALDPNKEYTVYLRTRDRVGNESEPVASTIHTLANMPETIGAELVNDDSASTKNVALKVNTNGNPDDTEYLAYYGTNPDAIENKGNGGVFSTLEDGALIVKGLQPGTRYYLQVVAQNKDGETTSAVGYKSIMISPAAPPVNSLYFREQEIPGGGIELHWNKPEDANVKGIQLYREGTFLGEVSPDQLSFTDYGGGDVKRTSDTIYRYSYAFVNNGGVGANRVAISYEYYNALFGANTDEKAAKQKKMDDLLHGHEGLFSEAITYPVYPVGVRSISAYPKGDDISGVINVAMAYDSSEMGRYQQYDLTLKAWQKKVKTNADGTEMKDENGDPIYETNEDGTIKYEEVSLDEWDPHKKHRMDDDDTVQKPVTTQVTSSGGVLAARAVWEELNTRYEYQICVQEIRSNGAAIGDNEAGQPEGTGIEGFLGKTYYVNYNGYGYKYLNDTTEPYLDTAFTAWTDDQRNTYTYGKKWDTPINTGYITFNKSANVKLANDPYAGNGSKIQSDESGQYLVIDQSMTDKTFLINVAAWDEDGLKDSTVTPFVDGEISDVTGSAGMTVGEQMPKTEEAAQNKPYQVKFDASGLSTGVYDKLTLSAYDGDTTTTAKDIPIRLIVNNNTPSSTVEGGAKRQLENGTPISKDDLVAVNSVITKNPTYARQDLAKIATVVMPEQYQAVFGISKYEELETKLCGDSPDATLVNKAKELLGETDAADPQYVNGNKLTAEGLKIALLRVAPPVIEYVKITEEQYNSLSEADKAAYALKEPGSNDTVKYWAQLDYALEQNNGLCGWLTLNEDGTVTPNVTVTGVTKQDTYTMKLMTRFGGNTSSQAIDFIIRNKPSATILSEKRLGWTDTHKDEYEYYQKHGITVQKILDRFADCYDPEKTTIDTADPSESAYRMVAAEDGSTVYQVYKLVDKKAQVDQTTIGGIIHADLGIHKKFTELGVLVAKQSDFDPNTNPDRSGVTEVLVSANQNGEKPIEASGDYYFNASSLDRDAIYYLWSFYELEDGTVEYSLNYTAITTAGAFKTAYFGFTDASAFYKEKDLNGSAVEYVYLEKISNEGAYGTVGVSAEYYEANEHGDLILDVNKQPIPITGDRLTAAKATVKFTAGTETVNLPFKATDNTGSVRVTLTDNTLEQGHMVVRLKLSIVSSDEGFCQIFPGREYFDIGVQDDESPVTSYILGVVNEDKDHKPLMKEEIAIDGSTNYYYLLRGLQPGYNEMGNLTVTYENIGTGDLENITAEVYEDMNGTTPSPYFEAESPSETNLLQSVKGAVGTVLVHPVANLEDGVYDGWLILTANNVEKKDQVRVHIRQVVGQSTLKGRIYITPAMPDGLQERTGTAKITLYDANNCSIDLTTGVVNMGEPAYTAETEMYGGEFTIENILNKVEHNGNSVNAKYHIVIERDGFVTYDSFKYNNGYPVLRLDGTTKTYTMDLRLLGGDLDNDQDIDEKDLEILIANYNKYPAKYEGTDQYDVIKRCDFNLDGVVNALDRAFLYGNLGYNGKAYSYAVLKADE